MAAVFLVEDDRMLRDVLCEALQEAGHDVVVFRDVDAVARHGALHGHCVALVDGWGTSHLDLDETDRESIQALASSMPTILLSGRAWIDRVRPEDLGVAALLRKPTDLNGLLDLVDRWGCRASAQ